LELSRVMSALCQKQTLARFQLRVDWDDLGNILPGSVILRRPIGGYQMLASRRASLRSVCL